MCLLSSYIVHLLNKINIIKNGVGGGQLSQWLEKKFANTVLKKFILSFFFLTTYFDNTYHVTKSFKYGE